MKAAAPAEASTLAELIHQRTAQLTPAERKLARTLTATNMMAGFDTVAELARRTRVSGPTVLRFVAKLGFAGYPQFQRALRQDLAAWIDSPLSLYRRQPGRLAGAPKGDFVEQACAVFRRGLESTFGALDRIEFDAVVTLLADRRRPLWITGGRFSQPCAELLQAHLYQLRPQSRTIGFAGAGRDDALLDVGRRDVLFIFDLRRYQRDSVILARKAAARDARIVLVTDPWMSPIADQADHVLTVDVDAPSPYDSLVAALALVETLVAAVIARLGTASQRRIAELERLRAGFTWYEDEAGADLPPKG